MYFFLKCNSTTNNIENLYKTYNGNLVTEIFENCMPYILIKQTKNR